MAKELKALQLYFRSDRAFLGSNEPLVFVGDEFAIKGITDVLWEAIERKCVVHFPYKEHTHVIETENILRWVVSPLGPQ